MRFLRFAFWIVGCSLFFGGASRALDRFTLFLDWYVNADHAALLWGREGGYFFRRGLDVRIITPSSSDLGLKLAVLGKIDAVVTYHPLLLRMAEQSIPLVRFASLVSQPLEILLTLNTGPDFIAAFRGKRVGVASRGGGHLVLKTVLAAEGMTMEDVDMTTVGLAGLQSLLAGQISVMDGAMRNVEPYVLASKGIKARVFYPERYGVPSYDALLLVANARMLRDRKNVYQRFVLALGEATCDLKAKRWQVWRVLKQKYPDLKEIAGKAIWRATIPLLEDRPGHLDVGRYRKFAAFYRMQISPLSKRLPLVRYARDVLRSREPSKNLARERSCGSK